MSFQGNATIGPYTLRKSLSEEGGMSQVFLAHDTIRPDRYAVIKVQLADDQKGAAFQDLLRQEAQLLRRVRHPGIIRIYPLRIDSSVSYVARAYDYDNQPWYFAMEYVSTGKTLDVYLKRIRKFPIEWCIELFYQLLVTIEYLHNSGFAHCDLKPQNVILRHPPDVNEVPAPVLIDFGSAAIIRHGIKQLSASIRYSPPEVITALERTDIPASSLIRDPAKIDVWSLGALLFEIVTGRPLIKWKRRNEITTTILREQLDNMRTLRPDVHPSLDKLLSVMLRRNPSERPEIEEIIRAIEERISSVRPPRVGQ